MNSSRKSPLNVHERELLNTLSHIPQKITASLIEETARTLTPDAKKHILDLIRAYGSSQTDTETKLKKACFARLLKQIPRNLPVIGSISILVNALYYWLDYAFILVETTPSGKQYRLIVYNKGKILDDETYRTTKGAKIAFLKIYGIRAVEKVFDGTPKPSWSPFYTPSKKWFNQFPPLDKCRHTQTIGKGKIR